jgi:hypothetical protein
MRPPIIGGDIWFSGMVIGRAPPTETPPGGIGPGAL